MKNTTYDFSSSQINLPQPISQKIVKWGQKNIPDKEIFKDPKDPGFGRENEIHVTVLYGIHGNNVDSIKKVLKDVKPFKIKLGKVKIFDKSDKFDVVHIDVISPELKKLNSKFCCSLAYTNKYKKYQPHITIAYLKHGEGSKYVGNTDFENKEFQADHVIFSPKEGDKEKILLNEGEFKSFLGLVD
jgi:2'-5' RNA ligase